ncbi:MAG: hypothetical protein IJO32_07635 [Bacilli bacterium]|nr:hypothetical protein [Bacilli bacterium]
MILKKPYALLIKYFKIIHIALSLFMIYLIYKSNNILKFFNDYIASGWKSINETEIANYINPLIFIFISLIIILSIIVYFLMRFKNKPRLYYILTPIMYLTILILFAVCNSILKDAQYKVINPVTTRAIRDVILIFMGFQIIFIMFSVLRGIGFDVKKFNFRQDIAELQIAELDNEEVEVNLEVQKYKIKRKYRRKFRNLKYVFLEHKFLFNTLFISIIFITILVTCLNIFAFNKTFKQNQIVQLDKYSIIVNNSYLYNTDFKGNEISDKYQYFVVDTKIINKIVDNTFNLNKLSLEVNGKDYSPVTNIYSKFLGLGIGYPENTELSTQTIDEYIFIFKIPVSENVKNVYLKYMYKTTYKNDSPVSNYRKIKLNYYTNLESISSNIKNLNHEMTIKDTKINIKSYEINNNFEYNYKFCSSNNNCIDSIGFIYSSNFNKSILKLDSIITMGSNLDKYSIKNKGDIFGKFGIIKYTLNSKNYVLNNFNNLTPSNINNDNIFLEVDKKISKADKISLELIIQNTKYTFNLKNE